MKPNILRTIAVDIFHLCERYEFDILPQPFMPEYERNFLESAYLSADVILEFGTGGSTLFAITNNKKVVSVESDRKFYKYFMGRVNSNFNLDESKVILARTGLTGRYGMPLFYPLSRNVPVKGMSYVLSGYSQFVGMKPDLIFIDGRWRIACCLYSLVLGWRDIKIILDDFDENRGYSNFIEKYFLVQSNGRLAELKPKETFDALSLVNDFVISLNNPE